MFSKNIILLLCVAGLIKNSSTQFRGRKLKILDGYPTEDINPNLDELLDKDWEEIYKKCDTDNQGLITTTELQNILFKEFKVFLTIRQAKTYIHLINLKESDEIGLEQLKKMKPIIYVLSQRLISQKDDKNAQKDDKNAHKDETKTSETVVKEMASIFEELFSNEREVLEVLKLVGVKDESPIEYKEYDEMLKMVTASLQMEHIYKNFLEEITKDGVIVNQSKNDDGVVDFHKYLSNCFGHCKLTQCYHQLKRKLKNLKSITFLNNNQ